MTKQSKKHSNPGEHLAQEFLRTNKALFDSLTARIDSYVIAGDGVSLLLMDAAMLALAQRIRDHVGARGVALQTLGERLAAGPGGGVDP